MTLEQVSLRVDTRLLRKLDEIAHKKYKRRSDVFRDALVDYVEHEEEISELKQMATEQFLEGDISINELSKIVGMDLAQQFDIAKDTLEESINRAKKDSRKSS